MITLNCTIQEIISAWAAWASESSRDTNILYKLTQDESVRRKGIFLTDDEAMTVEKHIIALRAEKPKCYDCLISIYCHRQSLRQAERSLACSKSTVQRNVKMAESFLSDRIFGSIDIGKNTTSVQDTTTLVDESESIISDDKLALLIIEALEKNRL